MKNYWLIEFITPDDDSEKVLFKNEPSDEDIELYVSEIPWLADEFESGTLEWWIEQIPFIKND